MVRSLKTNKYRKFWVSKYHLIILVVISAVSSFSGGGGYLLTLLQLSTLLYLVWSQFGGYIKGAKVGKFKTSLDIFFAWKLSRRLSDKQYRIQLQSNIFTLVLAVKHASAAVIYTLPAVSGSWVAFPNYHITVTNYLMTFRWQAIRGFCLNTLF